MVTTIPIQTSVQGVVKRLLNDGIQVFHGSGGPLSGIAPYGTGAGIVGYGAIYIDATNGNVFQNKGSITTPYWYPISWEQQGLLGAYTDFRGATDAALASTNDFEVLDRGVKVHGQGLAEADSGALVTNAENGPILTMTTTDEAEHLVGLSHKGTAPFFQPDAHGPLVVEAVIAQSAAITLRRMFIGFLGVIADALDPPVTGSGVTATLVQDDLAGMGFDVGFTATTALYAFHNKSDEAATQAVTSGSRDLGVVQPAAGTYIRLRVEISAAGVMTLFKDKVLLLRKEAALDVDEEVAPSVNISSTSAAVKSALLRQFMYWGSRNT